jgi:putative PEP-CTERM system TPR-repeat lipoprotein
MPSILLAGAVELNLGATQQAEQHLRKYLDKNPNNTYARKLLAQSLLKSSQPTEAVAALAPALQSATQDAQLLALAGESHLQAREFDKATSYFEKATALAPKAAVLHTSLGVSRLNQGDHDKAVSELQLASELDPKSSAAGFALVEAEMKARRFDKALAAVQTLEQRQPDNAQVQNLKGSVYAAKGDVAAARAAFDKALSLQPSYFTAVANQAQLDLVEKKPDAAKQRFEAFLAKDSKNFGAMAALAELAMLQGKPEEATGWLEKASNANPDAVGPALKLGVHYLGARQPQKALTLARKFLATNPSSPDLLDLLGQSQVATNDAAGALESYSKLVSVLPKSALAQLRLAGVHAMLKNNAAAADDLKRAIELNPNRAEARSAQVARAMRRGRADEALTFARQLQKLDRQAQTGLMLEGDLLMTQKKFAQAVPVYQKAYAAKPTAQLLIKTSEALKQAGKDNQAQQLVAQWQKAHPDESVVALYPAEAQLGEKQYKPAIAILQGVLKKDPNNPVALNNLAWAYQQDKDPRAVATAEHALKVSGDSPAVMDTLGWMLVEQGNTARGVALLQKAAALAPNAPDIRYHLAYALSKSGDKAGARKELDQLAAAKLPVALQDEVRSLRAAL